MHAKILIVEDERLIALDIKRRLQQLGYEVVAIAHHAEAALAAIAENRPDLILMDIHLQGEVDGIAVAAQILPQYSIPVIFVTAHADEATLRQAKATQPFGYLVKPVETHDLNTAIEIALTRHQAELAMEKALAKERELNELKSRFIAMVSHEFRNPLSTIQFSLDLLEGFDPSKISPEKKKIYLNRGRGAVAHMTQLLKEVLLIGEAETRGLQYYPEPLNLLWFCRDLVDEFQSQIDSRPDSIHFSVSGINEAEEPFYELDAKLLRHILTNLLSNAIKYSPEGGQVTFTLVGTPETLTFRIQDEGIGILPADQARLFESFHRGANVQQIPGTGLGLAIVKQCVIAHGGSITAESEIGKGTTFTVQLKAICA